MTYPTHIICWAPHMGGEMYGAPAVPPRHEAAAAPRGAPLHSREPRPDRMVDSSRGKKTHVPPEKAAVRDDFRCSFLDAVDAMNSNDCKRCASRGRAVNFNCAVNKAGFFTPRFFLCRTFHFFPPLLTHARDGTRKRRRDAS